MEPTTDIYHNGYCIKCGNGTYSIFAAATFTFYSLNEAKKYIDEQLKQTTVNYPEYAGKQTKH